MLGTAQITYGGVAIDLDKPFERLSMKDAVKKYSGVDFDTLADLEAAAAAAKAHGVAYEERHEKGRHTQPFFEEYCEEKLIQPTFITGHPVEISLLQSAYRAMKHIPNALSCIVGQRARQCLQRAERSHRSARPL